MPLTQEQIDRDRKYQFEKRQQEHADAASFYDQRNKRQSKRKGTPVNPLLAKMYPEDSTTMIEDDGPKYPMSIL